MIAGLIIMTIGIFIFTESLMLLRTIAFYRGNMKVYSLIFSLFIVSCIAGVISLIIWVHSLRATLRNMFTDPDDTICDLALKNQILILGTFAVLLTWETIITALVLRQAWVESLLCCRHCDNSTGTRTQGSFWGLLYKHGFLFYFCTLAITVINFALTVHGEINRLNSLFLSVERTIHTVAATRLILFTRLQNKSSTDMRTSFATDLQLEELAGDHHHHHHHYHHQEESDEDAKMDYSDSEHLQNTLSEIEEIDETGLSSPSETRSSSRTEVVTREVLGPTINVLPPSPTAPGHDRH